MDIKFFHFRYSDYDRMYEAKLVKTLKKFTAKPITQVSVCVCLFVCVCVCVCVSERVCLCVCACV